MKKQKDITDAELARVAGGADSTEAARGEKNVQYNRLRGLEGPE